MQDGMNGWTPEQLQQWQTAQQSLTPEQWQLYQQWQAAQQQGLTAEQYQYQQWQLAQQQGLSPEQWQALQWQTAQQQGLTPEQFQQYQQYQQYQQLQPQPPAPAWPQAQPGMTQEQVLQYQLGMTPEQVKQWKKAQRAAKRGQRKPVGPVGKALRIILAAAVLVVAGLYALHLTQGSRPTTAVIQLGSLGQTYTGDALIVRNETAYDDESVQTVEYVAQEGSTVYRGDIVCYVYSTGYSTKEMTALQDYRDQIKDYQRNLLNVETAYDQKMERLDSEVIQRGLEVRSLVQGARGNLLNQESILGTSITQRQNYFRSKYSSDMRLNRLYDDEASQEKRIDSWIKQRASTQESLVSFYTDGFEYALTPQKFETYTPTQVRGMIGGTIPDTTTASRGRTNIYRLVQKENYAVLMLADDTSWSPIDGSTYKLRLEQFSNTIVNAQVISSAKSGGELLVRLRVVGDVTPVLYMRTCKAELGDYADCLIVPPEAIYTREGQTGVVLVQDNQQGFVAVTIRGQSAEGVFVAAVQTGMLSQGQTVRLFY